MRLTDGKKVVDVRICQSYLCFLGPDESPTILQSDVSAYNEEKDAYFVKHDIDLLIDTVRETVQEVDAKNLDDPAANHFIRWRFFAEEVENNV